MKKPCPRAVSAESLLLSANKNRILGSDVKDSLKASQELNEQIRELKSESILLSLKLNADEILLMKKIFGSLALDDKMPLMDILGFSIYKDIISLGKYFKDSVDEISESYCANFLTAYISMLAKRTSIHEKRMEEKGELQEFYQRGTGENGVQFFFSLHEFSLRLKDIVAALKTALSRKLKIPSIRKEYNYFEKKISFFCKMIEHKDALICLIEQGLNYLKKYFPETELLNNSSRDKTIKDLNDFITFISHSFRSSVKKRVLGTIVSSFDDFQKNLSSLSASKKKMKVIQKLKQIIAENISMMQQPIGRNCVFYASAKSMAANQSHWNLSAKKISAILNIRGPQHVFGSSPGSHLDWTVRQFANLTLCMELSTSLKYCYWLNILRVFDYQIIQTISSTYIPTYGGKVWLDFKNQSQTHA